MDFENYRDEFFDERPTFIHFLNRELYRSLNIGYAVGANIALKVLLLGTYSPLIIPLSSIWEGESVTDLSYDLLDSAYDLGHVLFVSDCITVDEFIGRNLNMYSFDKNRYENYTNKYRVFAKYMPTILKSSSVTRVISSEITAWKNNETIFDRFIITENDRATLEVNKEKIININNNRGDNGITMSLFAPKLSREFDVFSVGRLISSQYIRDYVDFTKSDIATSINNNVSYYDFLAKNYPYRDVDILRELLTYSGVDTTLLNNAPLNFWNFILAERGTQCHIIWCNTLSRIIKVLFNDLNHSKINVLNNAFLKNRIREVAIPTNNYSLKRMQENINPFEVMTYNLRRTFNSTMRIENVFESKKIIKNTFYTFSYRKVIEKMDLTQNNLVVLHLSDLHLVDDKVADRYLFMLKTDISTKLELNHLDYIVLSGDIVSTSTKDEYTIALGFIDKLCSEMGIGRDHIIVVPGNHDLNWDISQKAYDPVTQKWDNLMRDKRFQYFSDHFYEKITSKPFDPDPTNQYQLLVDDNNQLVILGLNSAYEIDHINKGKSGICYDAIINAINSLNATQKKYFKIAVWHHPLLGYDAIVNTEFMDTLSIYGFKLCLHGHVHESKNEYYSYDDNHGIKLICAGTFGAKTSGRPSGIPQQYNILFIDKLFRGGIVQTRRREKDFGAWFADSRWGDKENPLPFYEINFIT